VVLTVSEGCSGTESIILLMSYWVLKLLRSFFKSGFISINDDLYK